MRVTWRALTVNYGSSHNVRVVGVKALQDNSLAAVFDVAVTRACVSARRSDKNMGIGGIIYSVLDSVVLTTTCDIPYRMGLVGTNVAILAQNS